MSARVETRQGMTLPRRCLDNFWIVTWRDRARVAIRDSHEALRRADRCFDEAAYWAAAEGQGTHAADWLAMAFKALETARCDRREAKRCARAALTGCI